MAMISRPPVPMRLPVRKPYTPEKPKGAKAMTIAVGFLCGDGKDLILAADRQITAQGAYQTRRKKYSTNSQGFVEMAFLYSGEPGTFHSFTQKVEESLNAKPEVSPEVVQETIEETLNTMKLNDPFLEPRFWLLAGVSEFWGPPKLIAFDGKYVFTAKDGVQIIGRGDTSLINYLGDRLYSPDLSPEQGIALAAYLIKKATQYVDGCGEPIDVLHGNGCDFRVVDKDKVSAGIDLIETQEEFLSTLLIQTPFSI